MEKENKNEDNSYNIEKKIAMQAFSNNEVCFRKVSLKKIFNSVFILLLRTFILK